MSLTSILFFPLIILNSCIVEDKDTSAKFEQKIEAYINYWNTGEFDGIEDVLHEDFELRMTPKFSPENGIEQFKKSIKYWRRSYPDFYLILDEVLYAKEAAAARWTITATNTGAGSHPPTGKSIRVSGISIVHFVDGKIKDEWIASNNLDWLKQLGFTITPPEFE